MGTSTAPDASAQSLKAYPFFILVLSVIALLLLGAGVLLPLSPEAAQVLDYADTIVCVFFLTDFVVQLVRADDRWRYFRTWGWLDLISSIPLIGVLRIGRIARIARLLRVLRGFRAARAMTSLLLEQRAQSGILAAGLIAVVLIIIASLAVLVVEAGADGNIRTAEDALWWAVTTITTVGYGDRYPVTTEGRLIAVFLMFAGIGLFGTLSGFLAVWFSAPSASEKDSSNAELAEVRQELADIKRILSERQMGGSA